MADTASDLSQTPAVPAVTILTIGVALIQTVLSTLPPEQAQQLAELAGTFVGNAAKPVVQQEVHDAFTAMFNRTAEVGRPDAAAQHDFDGLRQQ